MPVADGDISLTIPKDVDALIEAGDSFCTVLRIRTSEIQSYLYHMISLAVDFSFFCPLSAQGYGALKRG